MDDTINQVNYKKKNNSLTSLMKFDSSRGCFNGYSNSSSVIHVQMIWFIKMINEES